MTSSKTASKTDARVERCVSEAQELDLPEDGADVFFGGNARRVFSL